MTDQLRQAAQQALEALCSAVEPKNGKVYARGFEPIDCYAMHEQAITALRTALEQQQAKPVAQRPWVSLTKVQQDDFADAYGSYEAVCAIEQALKERNT